MRLTPEICREFSDLLGRLRDGQLEDGGLARLDALVSSDPAICALYQDYVNLYASLHWARVEGSGLCNAAGPRGPRSRRCRAARRARPPAGLQGPANRPECRPIRFRRLCADSEQSRRFLRAAVVPRQRPPLLPGGRMILGPAASPPGNGMRRTQFGHQACAGVAALPAMATTAGRTIVGRVTRTADCRLANANVVRVGKAVALGRKYSLVSGAGNRLCQRTDGHAPRPCHVRGGLADRRLPPRRRVGLPRRKEAKTCGSTDILHPYPSQGSPQRAPTASNPDTDLARNH